MNHSRESTQARHHPSFRRVTIVGAGRVGQAVGRILSGHGYSIDTVICKSSPKARAAKKFTRAEFAAKELTPEAFCRPGLIFITTPDSQIRMVADKLATLPVEWKKKFVFHTSGALTSKELVALKRRGARVASLHPLQTFPSTGQAVKRISGIFFTFEGDLKAEATARAVARACGGRMVHIQARYKPLYHCAGFFACGGLLAPLSAAFVLYRKIGIAAPTAQRMLAPMIAATLDGARGEDWANHITGPISRGDAGTVAHHLQALAQAAPELLEFYKALSRRLLMLMSRHLPPKQVRAIRKLLAN